MSGGNEGPFARWSRRKLATRPNDAPAANEKKHAPSQSGEEIEAGAPAPQSASPEATASADVESVELSEPLPRIEDLTAESDLAAFLREGVPLALKIAAMRKMWSLNPAIRDYVGPAEYAWDFNQPGSMAGFGPLETKETVVSFLSKTVRATETGADEAATGPQAPPAANAGPYPDMPQNGDADAEAEVPPPAAEPVRSDQESPQSSDAAQGSEDARATEATNRPVTVQRHGSALPR